MKVRCGYLMVGVVAVYIHVLTCSSFSTFVQEFFWIAAEIVPMLLFPSVCFPYFLNLETLYFSWQNKGGHSRTSKEAGKDTFGDYDYDNWHADHHTYHSANYGSAYAVVLDFYFGTQGRATIGAWGKKYTLKVKNEESVVMCIENVGR